MKRVGLRSKLLLGYLVLLLPILGFVVANFLQNVRFFEESVTHSQTLTAQAVAIQIEEAFDAAIIAAWTIAHDPIVQFGTSEKLNPHLHEIFRYDPDFSAIAVFSANGKLRGSAEQSLHFGGARAP